MHTAVFLGTMECWKIQLNTKDAAQALGLVSPGSKTQLNGTKDVAESV